MKTPEPYYKQDKNELFETIVRWSLDEPDTKYDELEVDIGDALHHYFEMAGPKEWLDVRDEARRFAERFFAPDFEEDSPIDGLLAATAAQAADGVWQTVAEAFGLEKQYVELVLAHWYEKNYDTAAPAPVISWEEFMRSYETERVEWESDRDAFAEKPKENT